MPTIGEIRTAKDLEHTGTYRYSRLTSKLRVKNNLYDLFVENEADWALSDEGGLRQE